MDVDGNSKHGVGCTTTGENKRGNSRGGDTEDYERASSARGGESVPGEGLACSSWAIDKEEASLRSSLSVSTQC